MLLIDTGVRRTLLPTAGGSQLELALGPDASAPRLAVGPADYGQGDAGTPSIGVLGVSSLRGHVAVFDLARATFSLYGD